jgi:WD40 repeat protein
LQFHWLAGKLFFLTKQKANYFISFHSYTAASASANWFKGKAAAAKERIIHSNKDHQSNADIGNFGASPRSHGDGSPTSIASSMRASDGQGLPVKVNVSKKPFKELTDLRLVQTVAAHQGVVWTMRFSKSGRYFATAGQDCVIAVWEVVLHRERERSGVELLPSTASAANNTNIEGGGPSSAPDSPIGSDTTANTTGTANNPSGSVYGIPVLRSRPARLYRGHKQDILDLAWSRTNFLLSASMDKTVRLWHVSMDECLRVFKHTDFVTAIDFHPSDDKLFVSGSIDGKVRLWNVPEQRVVSWQDVHDMITAVSYSRDGRRAVVGTMRGKCRFYGVSSKGTLEYEAQVDVKNKRGQHARGKKVTGLYFAPSSGSSSSSGSKGSTSTTGGGRISTSHATGTGGTRTNSTAAPAAGGGSSAGSSAVDAAASGGSLLITSNDSRVRLYDGYTLRSKYKGHSNKSTQIKASFSPKGDYVICGSDDGLAYIWSTKKTAVPGSPERNISISSGTGTGGGNITVGSGVNSGGGGASGVGASGGSGYLERISPLVRPGSAQIGGSSSTTTATTTNPITGSMKDPVAKDKNSSFESFQVASDVITVALFGPECTHRPLDNLSPTAYAAAEEAAAAGGAFTAAGGASGSGRGGGASLGTATAARGQIILAAGYSGEIKIYENIGLPQWL